jgi:hypothetical protein
VKFPARSSNLNAYPKRFVRSVKSECLAQIIPSGERHLRYAERNHQGLDNALIDDQRGTTNSSHNVERHERLGEMLNCYYRRAA